jgi:hypothetical protein
MPKKCKMCPLQIQNKQAAFKHRTNLNQRYQTNNSKYILIHFHSQNHKEPTSAVVAELRGGPCGPRTNLHSTQSKSIQIRETSSVVLTLGHSPSSSHNTAILGPFTFFSLRVLLIRV